MMGNGLYLLRFLDRTIIGIKHFQQDIFKIMTWKKHIQTRTKERDFFYFTPEKSGAFGQKALGSKLYDFLLAHEHNYGKWGVCLKDDKIILRLASYYPEEDRFRDFYYARASGSQRNRFYIEYEAPQGTPLPYFNELQAQFGEVLDDVHDAISGKDASHKARFSPGRGTSTGTAWDQLVDRADTIHEGMFLIDEKGKVEQIVVKAHEVKAKGKHLQEHAQEDLQGEHGKVGSPKVGSTETEAESATRGRQEIKAGKASSMKLAFGLIIGGIAAVHGSYHAITAVNTDKSTGEKKRNWTATVAYGAEAALGAGLAIGLSRH